MMITNSFKKMKSVRGVGEWAGYSYNCGVGCSHGCRYCFSASFFVQQGIVASKAAFLDERPNRYRIAIHQRVEQAVMFPSAHDITPGYLDTYCRTLANILDAGNRVLLVSKPHYDCIEHICQEFRNYIQQIELRFTIGSTNPEITSYWEPYAPVPEERMRALAYATEQGYQTSVSMEPILAGREDAIVTFEELVPLTNGTIWVGMMNDLDKRFNLVTDQDRQQFEQVMALQSADEMLALYAELKHEPQVRWKDSILDLVKNA